MVLIRCSLKPNGASFFHGKGHTNGFSSKFFHEGLKGKERVLKLRAAHFPEVTDEQLWHRKRNHGFTTLPRTLPIIMNIIDAQSKNKPAGRTYLGLWMRTFDEAFIIIENPMSFAAEAGFTGERAITSWKDRMTKLKDLGFIDARPGSSGDFHYVLLFNPHKVVRALRNDISQRYFMQIIDRAAEIGATDMDEELIALVPPPPAAIGVPPPPPPPSGPPSSKKSTAKKKAKETT